MYRLFITIGQYYSLGCFFPDYFLRALPTQHRVFHPPVGLSQQREGGQVLEEVRGDHQRHLWAGGRSEPVQGTVVLDGHLCASG